MAYVLDGIVILVVLLGLLLGYRRGFVRTIVKLVGCVMALVLAATLSQTVSRLLFDQFMRDKIQTSVATQVSAAEGESLQKTVENAVKTLPESVQQVLDHAGWVDNAIAHIGDSGVAQPQDVARSIVTYIVEPVVTSLLSILVFLVLFVLFMIAVSLLARLVGGFLKLPGLRQVDGILGAVLGTVEGVVLALVLVSVMQIAAASAADDAWLSRQTLNDTVVVSFMAAHNPVAEHWKVLPQ